MGELLEDGRRKVNAGICAARCSQHETGLLLSDSKSERSLTEVKYREPFWLHVGEKLQAFATRQSADSMRLLTGSFPRLSAYFSFLLSHFFAGPWPAFGLASAPSPGVRSE